MTRYNSVLKVSKEGWPPIGVRMCGQVYGDVRFPDGLVITTTEVKSVTHNEDGLFVVTKSGTIYLLEHPNV